MHRHPASPRLALASLLFVACDVPKDADSDTGSDESAGSESSADTGSDGECAFDDTDPFAVADAQPLVLTNSGETPLFVVSPACVHLKVNVDGVEYRLGTRHSCTQVALGGPCYDSCDGDPVESPIRIDPGASFEWPFAGYVWESVSIPDSCRPDCSQPDFGLCGIGRIVADGSLVEFEILVASECDQATCECLPGETACYLPEDNSGDEGGFGMTHSVEISFLQGFEGPVMVDVAG